MYVKPRYGSWSHISKARPFIMLGELIYLSDLQSLGVGNDKGEVVNLTQIVRGPDDGLYTKIEGIDGYVPLSIKGL